MIDLLFLSPSGGEIMLILLVVLLLFGSKNIPDIARNLGKGIREIKNVTGEIQNEIRKGMSEETKQVQDIADEIKKDVDRTL
jgi:sec-independent protein translocase protein TatA